MAKPALKIQEKDHDGVATLCRTLANGLAANPTIVPSPDVAPAALNGAADDLDAAAQALADHDEARDALVETLVLKRKAAAELATKSADDSAVETNYDKLKMETLLIPLASETHAAPDVSPLDNFHVSHGDHEGEVDGGCNRRKGAKLYRVRCGATATGPWSTGYEGARSTFTVTGQPVGQMCYFQMQAFVGGQWTEWSDIAHLRIV